MLCVDIHAVLFDQGSRVAFQPGNTHNRAVLLLLRQPDAVAVQVLETLCPDRNLYVDVIDGQWLFHRHAVEAREVDRLQQQGLVYPCYCSRGELHAASAPHLADGTWIYPGTCRALTPAQREAKTRRPAWRLMVPDRVYGVQDGLQGRYEENLAARCGDFIIRRSDGVYAYQLAVVTDDIEAGVTQVVRGRDLLSSTPRQLYLYELMGQTPPAYCHVPLLLARDGRRLSKRERDMDLGELRKTLTAPQLVGRLAWLAGLLDKEQAISARELAAAFSWDKVRKEDIIL